MKVLITGATGYVGHHLVMHFLRQKADVHVLVRPTSDVARLEQIGPSIRVERLAIERPEDVTLLREAIEKSVPDYIFHLASA